MDAVVGVLRERPGLRSRRAEPSKAPRAGLTFVPTKNSRGTSVTYRIAWRARAIRADPEAFLLHVRELLTTIATEATAQYADALTRLPRGRRASSVRTIANEEAELADIRGGAVGREGQGEGEGESSHGVGLMGPGIPDDQNPMPIPASRRHELDAPGAIDPNLLSGLSLPMLSRRLKESRR